jgi:putative methyltransferase (TIGR04325 family)
MVIKKLLKELIPPVFYRVFKHSAKKTLQPTFKSYKDALMAAESYEEQDLIKVIVAKTKKYLENEHSNNFINFDNLSDSRTTRTLFAIAAGINKKTITILDFGGSAGIHYFTARKIISNDISLKWCVVETESMVSEAKNEGLENEELFFFSTIEEASNKVSDIDIIYSNYALCYTPNPLFYLEQLLQTNFDKFFLTNIAVNRGDKEIVGLQTSFISTNGVGRDIPDYLGISDREIIYPFTIPSKEQVESKIRQYGNIVYSVKEVEATYQTVEGSFDNYGYLITRKK